MRKSGIMVAAMALMLGCAACGSSDDKATTVAETTAAVTTTAAPTEATTVADTTTEAATEETTVEATTEAATDEATTEAVTDEETTEANPGEVKVMSYAEYMAAEDDDEICIEAYVQAKQSWWNDKATIYTQDEDGAYFIYEMVCSEEDYAKLVPGTKIRVKGFKTTWSGEVEVASGATFEIIEGSYIAPAKDVTALLANEEELVKFQNQFAEFKTMTVVASTDKDDKEVAYLYKWDGSGSEGDDLYFNVKYGYETYTFTVESYLCGADTAVYQAVKELKIGDVIDMEGFLYWYNGVNPHITSVSSVKVMTYDEYMAAEDDEEVLIDAYVQGKQSWWNNKATVYLQDEDGAYFAYEMVCSKDDYEYLVTGSKIRIRGYKTTWSGEIEIASGATFQFLDGYFNANPLDVTEYLGTDDLVKYQNRYVEFKGMKIVASKDKDGNEAAFLYKWDGSGSEGEDLYFNVSLNDQVYTFTVESYLTDADSDVYKAVKELKIGDVVDMEGFLYWYNGVNPHITYVEVVESAEVAE